MAQPITPITRRPAPGGLAAVREIERAYPMQESTLHREERADPVPRRSPPLPPRRSSMDPATTSIGSHARDAEHHADDGLPTSRYSEDNHPNGHANLSEHGVFGRPSTHSTDYRRDGAGLGGARDYLGREDEGYDRMNEAARYAGENADRYGRHEQEFNRYGQEGRDHQEHGFLGQRHGLSHHQEAMPYGNGNNHYESIFESDGYNDYSYDSQYNQGFNDYGQQGQGRGDYDYYGRGYGGMGAGRHDQYSQQLY